MSPIKIKSCKDPFLSLIPHRWTLLHSPCWQRRAARAFWSARGHSICPPSLWLCAKVRQGRRCKVKRVVWNSARCQRGPSMQAFGKHSASQERSFHGENPGSRVRKTFRTPQSRLEIRTCAQPSCISARSLSYVTCSYYIHQIVYQLWQHIAKGPRLILLMVPCRHPTKILINRFF